MNLAGFERGGASSDLFVVLHAFCQDPERLEPVRAAIRDACRDADIYTPKMPFAGKFGWLCTRAAADVVVDLIKAIDRIADDRKSFDGSEYRSVNFAGHSIGAVIARKVCVIAHGEQSRKSEDENLRAPFEPQFDRYREAPRSWAHLIRRIVLIAGMNRGWSTSSAMDWLSSVGWGAATFVGETVFNGRPIIFDIRQGAVFSVQTRLQWLALMHRETEDQPRPAIVVTQLLGTIDDMVSPDDSVDYAVDASDDGGNRSYFYLEVPNSGHSNIIDMKKPEDGHTSLAPRKRSTDEARALSVAQVRMEDANLRYNVFRCALREPPESLARHAVPRDQMTDSLPSKPNWAVKDVVFVIHGIRDKGFWTQKIARAIKQEAAGRKQDFRSVTTSYGYFAMAPFVLPWIRKGKAEWLMDQYAEARAHYPRASFSYVGHSNGTYLVARALLDYPAARFKRIALAGSVVRCDYGWKKIIDSGRVTQVLNYVATRDWVVAVFPKGMQRWRVFDLGSAGHDGFKEASDDGPVRQVSFITGSHGAGHEERHWSDIAKFVVEGTIPQSDASIQDPVVRTLGYLSTPILLLLLVGVFWIGFLIGRPVLCKVPYADWFDTCSAYSSADLKGTVAAFRTFAVIAYFWLVYIVISRV